MQSKKNKFICTIITLLVFSLILPFCSYATEDTSYVWSELSSPIVSTSSVPSVGEREFFMSYLWQCYFD